jgi:hypothetical protein
MSRPQGLLLPHLRSSGNSKLVPDDRVHAKWILPIQVGLADLSSLLMKLPSMLSSCRRSKERRQATDPVNVDLAGPQSCCICYQAYDTAPMDGDAEMPVRLPCGHIFGDTCTSKWMSTKNTCPLCKFELFHVDHNDDDYSLWVSQHDSQTFGTAPGYHFTSSYVPEYPWEFPWEEVTLSELGLSPPHSSTATHRFFETRAATSSAHTQQASRFLRMHNGRGQRSGHRKASNAYTEFEDIWITALPEEKDELDVPSIEDVWLSALDDDEDDFYLPKPYRLPQPPVQELCHQEAKVSESVFEDRLVDHLQWMEDVAEDIELDGYDEYDYLV